VIDSLSRMVVEYTGSNQTDVQAWVVASRDALQPYLAGGNRKNQNETTSTTEETTRVKSKAEESLQEIQLQRERAGARPVRLDDQASLDEGDETGIYSNILDRDFSDWVKCTQTGAQLSASEVQGVLLLSDVYGPFSDDTTALAEKIAFECQPVVVMVPDLFDGQPHWGPNPRL
jgi:hypothetical protein